MNHQFPDATQMSPREASQVQEALFWQREVFDEELELVRIKEQLRADKAIRTARPLVDGLLMISGAAIFIAGGSLYCGDLQGAVFAAVGALITYAASRAVRDWRGWIGEEEADDEQKE